MALQGAASLRCWGALPSSHRPSSWRLCTGAEVVLTGGTEVTAWDPQRLWKRVGGADPGPLLLPSPPLPPSFALPALATPHRPPSAALRSEVSKPGCEPQSLWGDNQVGVGDMTAKAPPQTEGTSDVWMRVWELPDASRHSVGGGG